VSFRFFFSIQKLPLSTPSGMKEKKKSQTSKLLLPPRHRKQPEARRLRADRDPGSAPRPVRQRLGAHGLLPWRVLHPPARVVVEQEIVGRAEQAFLFFVGERGQRRDEALERVRVVSLARGSAEDGLGVDA